MVSKRIDANYLETFFVLKYCIIYQICAKSVYSSSSAILQCMLCISFLWERRGFLPVECL